MTQFMLNWADYIILLIIAFSAVISVIRGFVREFLSLAGWILAIWLAFVYASQVSRLFEQLIETPSLRMAVAFGVIFLVVLVLVSMVNVFFAKLIKTTGLSGTDRSLGFVFGLLRGVLIVGVVALLASFTPVSQDTWWKESKLVPYFERVGEWIKSFLPDQVNKATEAWPKTLEGMDNQSKPKTEPNTQASAVKSPRPLVSEQYSVPGPAETSQPVPQQQPAEAPVQTTTPETQTPVEAD